MVLFLADDLSLHVHHSILVHVVVMVVKMMVVVIVMPTDADRYFAFRGISVIGMLTNDSAGVFLALLALNLASRFVAVSPDRGHERKRASYDGSRNQNAEFIHITRIGSCCFVAGAWPTFIESQTEERLGGCRGANVTELLAKKIRSTSR
jgi:hypothetical protein